MRQLAQLDEEALARRLRDFMLAEGIDATVNSNADGGFSIWVHDDALLDDAKDLLELFERDPESPRVVEGLAEVKRRRREREVDEAELMRRVASIERAQHLAMQVRKAGPVTHFMIFAMVGFAVMATFFTDGHPERVYAHLTASWESIAAGELWRLVTPAFVRFGLPHPVAVIGLLFGVFWIRTLGGPVERLHGSLTLAAMMLLSAGLSTAAELALFGTSVGGAMGSAATLFAYLWVRGRLDPSLPVRLRRDIAFWMLAWFFLTLAGPNGADFAPRWFVGLAVGSLWAVVVSRRPGRAV
jgi:GlpG protein